MKMGEIKGAIGERTIRKTFKSTQSKQTVKLNAKMMEEEMFESSCSRGQYMGKLLRGVIKGDPYFPIVLGCKRWCLEDGKVVCKEVIKIDKKLFWAECMEYEELVRTTGENDYLTIPVDGKNLAKELAWRDYFIRKTDAKPIIIAKFDSEKTILLK